MPLDPVTLLEKKQQIMWCTFEWICQTLYDQRSKLWKESLTSVMVNYSTNIKLLSKAKQNRPRHMPMKSTLVPPS